MIARSVARILMLLLIPACIVSASTTTARADLLGLLAGDTIDETLRDFASRFDEISERRVRELLVALESTAEESIAEGIAGGQLLAVQAGHSLNVATQSAAAIIGDQIDNSVSEIDRSLQEMLVLLVRLESQVKEARTEAFDFADLLSLDLEIIAGRVVGIDDAPLHLRGFSNTVFAVEEGSGNKSVTVRGPFFGSDPDSVTSEFDFSINGTSLGSGRSLAGLNSKHDREVIVPESFVLPQVSEAKIQTLEMRLDVKRTTTERCWLVWSCEDDETFQAIIPLTILPRLIGTVTVEETRPQYKFEKISERLEVPQRVGASVNIQVSIPAILGSGPSVGQRIFDRNDVLVSCIAENRDFRRFIQDDNQGKELPANHTLFVDGFTAKNVGPGRHSRGNDVDGPGTIEDVRSRIASRMEPHVGKGPFQGRAPLRKLVTDKLSHLVYQQGWHTQDPWRNYDMVLSARELSSSAIVRSYQRDISGCADQTHGPPVFRNDTDFQVPITSSTTTSSTWKISVGQLKWSEDGREEERETLDVRVGSLLEFEVDSPSETDVLLHFKAPILGVDERFTPGSPIEGFEFMSPGRVGDAEIRRFRFRL